MGWVGELAPPSKPQPDGVLVKALARAWRWQKLLDRGAYSSVTEIAEAERISKSYVSRILRLALLAPDIVEAILGGWADQRVMLEWLETAALGRVGGAACPLTRDLSPKDAGAYLPSALIEATSRLSTHAMKVPLARARTICRSWGARVAWFSAARFAVDVAIRSSVPPHERRPARERSQKTRRRRNPAPPRREGSEANGSRASRHGAKRRAR